MSVSAPQKRRKLIRELSRHPAASLQMACLQIAAVALLPIILDVDLGHLGKAGARQPRRRRALLKRSDAAPCPGWPRFDNGWKPQGQAHRFASTGRLAHMPILPI
jgi:hypothetical protein